MQAPAVLPRHLDALGTLRGEPQVPPVPLETPSALQGAPHKGCAEPPRPEGARRHRSARGCSPAQRDEASVSGGCCSQICTNHNPKATAAVKSCWGALLVPSPAHACAQGSPAPVAAGSEPSRGARCRRDTLPSPDTLQLSGLYGGGKSGPQGRQSPPNSAMWHFTSDPSVQTNRRRRRRILSVPQPSPGIKTWPRGASPAQDSGAERHNTPGTALQPRAAGAGHH